MPRVQSRDSPAILATFPTFHSCLRSLQVASSACVSEGVCVNLEPHWPGPTATHHHKHPPPDDSGSKSGHPDPRRRSRSDSLPFQLWSQRLSTALYDVQDDHHASLDNLPASLRQRPHPRHAVDVEVHSIEPSGNLCATHAGPGLVILLASSDISSTAVLLAQIKQPSLEPNESIAVQVPSPAASSALAPAVLLAASLSRSTASPTGRLASTLEHCKCT